MTVRLLFGRPLPGTVGETRRVVHVFELSDDVGVVERLTALCGVSFGRGELEHLDQVKGMPCESCLRETPTPDPALTAESQAPRAELGARSDEAEPVSAELLPPW